ncbi:Uma2 family endonuclease [uncultured Lamprocystis sp.]|jgi:Uma2 family endonuclease|uniref:Uma2 family endonuclease n=1 Tax=uncultured Lamprocystis sp. TaxID=543132 RepID=UPI0025F4B2D0|nr:Uma2 family endonuclease [uncultured Lamprocystis sp.]
MSSTAEDLIQRHRYTVEDYYRMGEVGILAPDARVELIDGEVIEMPPIGAPHASIVTDLQTALVRAVGDAAVVRVQNPIQLGRHDEPQPDIALVRPPGSKYRRRHPAPADIVLLIEVADTTLRYDRDVKIQIYGRAGIPEAWLLDVNARSIRRYRAPSHTGYLESEPLTDVTAVRVPGLESVYLDLSCLL